MEFRFNERAFLIRALMAVFVLQFLTVGYQTYSCQTAIRSIKESDKVSVICENATTSFNETGKLALATFLALLVPAAGAAAPNPLGQQEESQLQKNPQKG